MPTNSCQDGPYTTAFFLTYAEDSYRSARGLLPLVRDLIQPKRIVDVGCGVGTWLRVWEELGASAVLGIDGDYVSRDQIQVNSEKFVAMDLTKPGAISGLPFDLAQSLEVAEHLPQEAAPRFVSFLCSLSPVVLFSAAIPGQGGTSHINEQWPEYWARLFAANGYAVFDVIRPRIWNDRNVAYYYAQNALLFVSDECLGAYPILRSSSGCDPGALARVHPRKWEAEVNAVPHFEYLLAAMPRSAVMLARRIGRRVQQAIVSHGHRAG